MNISRAKCRRFLDSSFLKREQSERVYNKFIGRRRYDRNVNGRKGGKREARGKPSNKVEKVDSPTTRTRVIACLEQISAIPDSALWLIYSSRYASSDELSPSSSGARGRGLNMCKNRRERHVKVSQMRKCFNQFSSSVNRK